MWEQLTQRAQRAVHSAYQEAEARNLTYVSTEHLLLGLLREENNAAARLLARMGVPLDLLCADTARHMESAPEANGKPAGEMTWTPRVRRVLRLACEEAERVQQSYVGPEHLLLGLLRERNGLAGRMLARHGADLDVLRELLSEDFQNAVSVSAASAPDASMPLFACGPTLPPVPPPTGFPESAMKEEDLSRLLGELQQSGKTRRPLFSHSWHEIFDSVWITGLLLGIAAVTLEGQWKASFVVLLFFFGVRSLANRSVSGQQKKAAGQIAASGDIRIVGRLVDLMAWPEPIVAIQARNALTELLPRLRPDYISLFTREQYTALCRSLTPQQARTDPHYVCAALMALQRIGDESALSMVERLAAPNHRVSETVRAAAETCLPHLRERIELRRAGSTLLRPAFAASSAPDALLRPASDRPSDTASEELLRSDPASRLQP